MVIKEENLISFKNITGAAIKEIIQQIIKMTDNTIAALASNEATAWMTKLNDLECWTMLQNLDTHKHPMRAIQ